MVIQAILLSTLLSSEPAMIPTPPVKLEASRRGGKKQRDRRRGGNGLR